MTQPTTNPVPRTGTSTQPSTGANVFSDDPVPTSAHPPAPLIFERDVPIPMRDGVVLRGNLYRPADNAAAPVLMNFGPYGKDLSLAARQKDYYDALGKGVFLNWETPDPEYWVPRGYAVLRVDSRGSGASPGLLDAFSAAMARDHYDAIEWAGTQPWSTGKVGLLGISFYAMTQWTVAALQPPHLTAMMPWEGAVDAYRDFIRHGGILNADFMRLWGGGILAARNPGSEAVNLFDRSRAHPLDDAAYTDWTPDLGKIEVPFVSVGNWGNLMLHLRGNIEGFVHAASSEKWLRILVGGHILPFYSPEALALQESFFGHYLKGEDTGWLDQPPVRVALRGADGISWRDDTGWPLTGTEWRDLYLDATDLRLGDSGPASDGMVEYPAPEGTASFLLPPGHDIREITGPIALRLWVSSSSTDADFYVTLRQITADGDEVFGINPVDQPVQPLAQGWLRASHRKTDPDRSLPYRPYLVHDEQQDLVPDEIVAVDIEVWPTSIVLAPGDQLLLEISSSDNETIHVRMDSDEQERPVGRFNGTNRIHTGPNRPSALRIPVILADPA
ncbi:CocE/NonD family hydrolase [Promicromonospora sp. NPDC023987]|uniref:CocE/NonD family hydrolase n=1 Tax=Promicromonospora sp. NPDC023987 TaxID=3155360 RepID=UPI0033F916FE